MGYRDYFLDKKPLLGASNNALVWLIGINCITCIIFKFLSMVYHVSFETSAIAEDRFKTDVLYWLALSPNAHDLLIKPWSLFTYMFAHYDFMKLFSNSLWLWCFGYIMQDLMGNKKIIPLYIYGGFIGGIVYVMNASYIPALKQNISNLSLLDGGNFSVMAIAIATTVYAPMYKLFRNLGNGVPLFILTIFYLAINLSYISQTNEAFGFGNFIAAIFGFIFTKQLINGNDWSTWMYRLIAWLDDLFNPNKKYKNKSQNQKSFYNNTKPNFIKKPNLTEKRTNEILEKINSLGYERLSQEEKDFLDRLSVED